MDSDAANQEFALCGAQPILHLTCGKCASEVFRPGEDGRYECNGCGRNLDYFADEPDDLQRRADEVAKVEYAAEANLDLQRVYSGLMTVEEFEERYGR